MKARKYGVFAVTAAAVFMTALLMTNCADPMRISHQDPVRPGANVPNNIRTPMPTPAGLGAIGLGLHSETAATGRTLLPVAPLPDLDDMYFEVIFWPVGGAPGDEIRFPSLPADPLLPHERFGTGGAPAGPFLVEAGSYTIEILAFTQDDRGALLGRGTIGTVGDPVVVVDSAVTNQTVTMHPIFADPVDGLPGTFTWAVTASPTGGSTTEVTITSLIAGQEMDSAPLTLNTPTPLAGLTGTAQLSPGYYRVTVTATHVDTAIEDRTYTRILHIYSTLTTAWPAFTMPALNVRTPWTVTFFNVTGTVVPGPPPTGDSFALINQMHGDLLPSIGPLPANQNVTGVTTTPPVAGATLLGWHGTFPADGHTNPGATWGAQWILDETTVRRATNLFARWSIPAPADGGRTITLVDWADQYIQAPAIISNSVVFSTVTHTDDFGAPLTAHEYQTFTVPGGFTDIVWDWSLPGSIQTAGGGAVTGNIFTVYFTYGGNLAAAHHPFSDVGVRHIFVTARSEASGNLYSATITVTTVDTAVP